MITILEYTGHIRNWKTLCVELQIDMSLNRDQREKQIMACAYEKWGVDMGNHIYGMFALILWDPDNKKYLCIRDQFGTKSLYYYITEDRHLLASLDIVTLAEKPGFKKEFNQDMLQLYLTFTYPPGEDTFFKGVKKLRPGSCLVWENKELKIYRYWRPYFSPDHRKKAEQWAEDIHSTMEKIMEELEEEEESRLSFLSSGVDSSYVTAMTYADKCITCGYENFSLDESACACQTADMLGKECCINKITPEEYFKSISETMCSMEQPLGDASAPVFALSCKKAAEYGDIVYSGEGADEFFAGYHIHRNAAVYGDGYIGNTNIMKEKEKSCLLKQYNPQIQPVDVVRACCQNIESFTPLSRMLAVDMELWLDGDIYLNVEKMSKAAGIEVRMPFTDIRLFRIAAKVPDDMKINEKSNKLVLRYAASRKLPEEIIFRKKIGFAVPIRTWLSDSRYNQDVLKRLHGKTAEKFFNIDKIDQIYQEYLQVNSDYWRKIWTIYTFLVWYEDFYKTL